MNVLMLPSWYPPNGGEFFRDQALALRDAGIDMEVVSVELRSLKKLKLKHFLSSNRQSLSTDQGMPTFRTVCWKLPKNERLNTLRWIASTQKAVEQYIDKKGIPELIYVQSCLWAGVVAARLAKDRKIPYCIAEHRGRFGNMTDLARAQIQSWHLPLLREALRGANRILPVSELLIPKLNEIAGCQLPVKVVHNMTDTDFFVPATERVPRKEFTFLVVAGLSVVKGLDVLLEAFRRLIEHYPYARLRIGGDGDQRQNLEMLTQKYGLQNQINFLGNLDRQGVKNEMQHADCLVLSSRIEAMPVVIIEAMACGIPIVATEVVSARLVSEDCGYLVAPESANAMTEALSRMIENHSSFDSGVIRQKAITQYSRQRFQSEMKVVFQEIRSTC